MMDIEMNWEDQLSGSYSLCNGDRKFKFAIPPLIDLCDAVKFITSDVMQRFVEH